MNEVCTLGERYKIIKKLGSGGYGDVFLVEDLRLGKLWAAKCVKDGTMEELNALKKINSAFFPKVIDIISDAINQYIYIIMDYMEGENLESYCKGKRLDEKRIIELGIMIASAINQLHHGVPPMLYLDCKPSNIIIGDDGTIKMVDLGSIYIVDQINTGRLSGTGWYAPDEQKTCGNVDIRTDIYALGRTLYFLAVGGKTIFMDKKGHIRARKGNPEISESLDRLIMECCSAKKEDRPANMNQVIEKLERCGRENGITRFIKRLEGIAFYIGEGMVAALTVILYYMYNLNKDLIYILSGGLLFILLITLCSSRSTAYTVKPVEDIFLGTGKRILALVIATGTLGAAMYKCGTYRELYLSQRAREITIIDVSGFQCVYRGQETTIRGNDILMKIPVDSITRDTFPKQFIVHG